MEDEPDPAGQPVAIFSARGWSQWRRSKHLENPVMRYRNVDGMRAGILESLALLLALQGSWTWAETQVYKSTDAKGRVTYGDKPTPGAVVVEDMGITAPDPAISEEERQKRIDNIVETTNRLRDDRLLREKAQADARPPAPPPPTIPGPDYGPEFMGYAPQILGYPGYRRYVHPHRGVPFGGNIHGKDGHYQHRIPARHHRGHEPSPDYHDLHPTRGEAEPRTPYRAPRLLRNPRP
jgi:hypothetical protein